MQLLIEAYIRRRFYLRLHFHNVVRTQAIVLGFCGLDTREYGDGDQQGSEKMFERAIHYWFQKLRSSDQS